MARMTEHTAPSPLRLLATAALALVVALAIALGCPLLGTGSIACADDAQAPANSPSSASSSSSSASDDDEDGAPGERKTPETDNLVDPTQRADNSFIYDTTIESLFEEAALYDGRIVQVVGEVIGDKIASDEEGRCWITLTSTNEDNQTTISALLTEEQARQIDHYGRYGITGTTFQVRGTYHQSCTEHEGLPDIHVTDSTTISRGIEHHDKLKLRRFIPGAALVFFGFLLMGAYYYVRERTR